MKIIGIAGKKGSGKTTLTNAIISYYNKKKISVIELSFASALKQICVDIFNIKIENFIDPALKDKPINPKCFKAETSYQKKINIISIKFDYSEQKSISVLLNIFRNMKLIHETGTRLPSENIVRHYIDIYNVAPREIMQVIGLIFRRNSMNTWVDIINKKLSNFELMQKFDVVIISDLRFKNELRLLESKKNKYLIKINRPSLLRNEKCDMHRSETDLDDLEGSFDHVITNIYDYPESFQKHTISILSSVL